MEDLCVEMPYKIWLLPCEAASGSRSRSGPVYDGFRMAATWEQRGEELGQTPGFHLKLPLLSWSCKPPSREETVGLRDHIPETRAEDFCPTIRVIRLRQPVQR